MRYDKTPSLPRGKCSTFNLRCFQVDEIAARTRAIWVSARYLQNSFVPVNRLPPEVLGLIPSSLRSKRDLINTTAVCRHWRNTLLSSPDLWCDIDCSGNRGPLREHMFREYLERSRMVPLNVRLTSVKYLPDITPCLARFSALEIELAVPEQLRKIAAHFSQPAPILQRLDISAAASLNRTSLSIPRLLFGGDFAPLRTFRIKGFSDLKMRQHFPHLIRFDLQIEILNTGVMLEVLERMPSLQVLRIKFRPVSHPSSTLMPTLHPMTHHKLREVELSPFESSYPDPIPFMPPLLFALTLPSAEQITIGMLPPVGSHVLPSSFEERLPNFAETPVVDVCVGLETFGILFHGPRGSRLLFTTHRRFYRERFHGIPFLSVQKLVLTLTGLRGGFDDYFIDLLRARERLEYLEMKGFYTGILRFWSMKPPEEQRSICPSLRRLMVVKQPNESVAGLLAELVMARDSHGVPLVEAIEVDSHM